MIKNSQFKKLKFYFIGAAIALSSLGYSQSNEVLIITSTSSNLTALTLSEIRQIYLGGTLSRRFEAVSLPIDSTVRKSFNIKILGLTENRIQSYWAQLLFTGRSAKPTELESVEQIMEYVSEEKNRIAYVPFETALPEDIAIIFRR